MLVHISLPWLSFVTIFKNNLLNIEKAIRSIILKQVKLCDPRDFQNLQETFLEQGVLQLPQANLMWLHRYR